MPDATPTPASGARAVKEETDDFLFEYSYPAEAGNIAELALFLDRRLEASRTELAKNAAEGRETAGDNGFPFNKYFSGVEWEVVADTPRFLSMSADISSYSGGAHGNYGFSALVWDKEQTVALKPETFFESLDGVGEAVSEEFCDALNAERAKRRPDQPIEANSVAEFDQCVDLSDTTLLLGSSGGEKFDKLGIQIGPYVAGPYAEGAYEFTFDIDQALLDAVKEEYRPFFAARNRAS